MPRGIYQYTPESPEKLQERMMKKVNKNGPIHPYDSTLGNCWIWQGHITKYGYGEISVKNKAQAVHRISYELFNRPIPEDHRLIRHTCDNRACVNPAHLLSGTDADNAQDHREHGRIAYGEKNPMAKITEDQAREIISLLDTMSQYDIGKKFGIGQTAVSKIARGLNWPHLPRKERDINFYPDYRKPANTSHEGLRGTDNIRAKLTDDKVREILVLLGQKQKQRVIARQYDVSQTVINNIAKEKSWTHIERLKS